MYIIKGETDCQSRFDAWDRVLRAGALGWPRGIGWGGRWEGASGWGTHVYPWLIHVNVWQKPLQYYKVICLQLNKFLKKDRKGCWWSGHFLPQCTQSAQSWWQGVSSHCKFQKPVKQSVQWWCRCLCWWLCQSLCAYNRLWKRSQSSFFQGDCHE